MTFLRKVWVVAGFLFAGTPVSAAPPTLPGPPLAEGQPAPAFTYHLLDGRQLPPSALRGHPYLLYVVATWCGSCLISTKVIGRHVDFLRQHDVQVVEMRLFEDLGAPGIGLKKFQKVVGPNATSPIWHWGELTKTQTAALDPDGAPSIYYLVDANGTIVMTYSDPKTTWDWIERFVTTGAKPS